MSDVKVYFLGEQYSVPEELKVFVDYLHYFENLHNELMPLLTNQIKEKEYSGNADEDFEYFKTPLSKSSEKVISKLAENGIYDVTLNDLVYNNKGYTQLYTVCSETIRGMIKILSDAVIEMVKKYIIELRQNVEKYRLEVDSAKRKYDYAKKNYDKKLKKLKDKETDLKSQRSSLGFFAFSKKKEIDSQLSELQKEIEELKVADETRKLQKEYERLLIFYTPSIYKI